MARAVFFQKKPKQDKLKILLLFQTVVFAALIAAGALFRLHLPSIILGFLWSSAFAWDIFALDAQALSSKKPGEGRARDPLRTEPRRKPATGRGPSGKPVRRTALQRTVQNRRSKNAARPPRAYDSQMGGLWSDSVYSPEKNKDGRFPCRLPRSVVVLAAVRLPFPIF